MHLILTESPNAGSDILLPLLEHLGFGRAAEGPYRRWLEATRAGQEGLSPATAAGATAPATASPAASHAEFVAACQNPTILDARDRPLFVDQLLNAAPDTTLLVVYRPPERTLAGRLAAGERPEQAMRHWLEATSQLLGVIRHHRARTLVVDIEQVVATPNLFLDACRQRLNLKCKPWTSNLDALAATEAPLYQVIAGQLVAGSDEVQALSGELEASALALGDPIAAPIDCDAAWQQLTKEQQQHRAELETLQHQLEQTKAEASPPTVQPQSTAVTRELEEAKEENELLLTQLHQVQEELEHYYLQAQSKSQPMLAYSNAQAKLERMEKTLSWRITAPLRWGFRPFKRRFGKMR